MASATCSPPASQDCECPAITAGLGPPARQWSLAGKAQALWLGVKIPSLLQMGSVTLDQFLTFPVPQKPNGNKGW